MQMQEKVRKEPVHLVSIRHRIQLTPDMKDALYEKAFYSREEDPNSEYSHNTTTWD